MMFVCCCDYSEIDISLEGVYTDREWQTMDDVLLPIWHGIAKWMHWSGGRYTLERLSSWLGSKLFVWKWCNLRTNYHISSIQELTTSPMAHDNWAWMLSTHTRLGPVVRKMAILCLCTTSIDYSFIPRMVWEWEQTKGGMKVYISYTRQDTLLRWNKIWVCSFKGALYPL